MGLDLICYEEMSEPYWSMSYSTFDSMRYFHKQAVDEKAQSDKYLFCKLQSDIAENAGLDYLSLEETRDAFYKHSDCDGSWIKCEIKSILAYLESTLDIYKDYVKKGCEHRQDELIGAMEGLIECLKASDHIEFS